MAHVIDGLRFGDEIHVSWTLALLDKTVCTCIEISTFISYFQVENIDAAFVSLNNLNKEDSNGKMILRMTWDWHQCFDQFEFLLVLLIAF